MDSSVAVSRSKGKTMDDIVLKHKLYELVKEIDSPPKAQQENTIALANKKGASYNPATQNVNSLYDLLDYLRFIIKYQSFDLEATRRENAYLKRIIGYDDW